MPELGDHDQNAGSGDHPDRDAVIGIPAMIAIMAG
jgi:hypothetical protein